RRRGRLSDPASGLRVAADDCRKSRNCRRGSAGRGSGPAYPICGRGAAERRQYRKCRKAPPGFLGLRAHGRKLKPEKNRRGTLPSLIANNARTMLTAYPVSDTLRFLNGLGAAKRDFRMPKTAV